MPVVASSEHPGPAVVSSLSVYLSGDAWQGNPKAVVTVNGVEVGGVLDVAASHSRDDVQVFTLEGAFGPSPAVAVSFVNDAYGGTPTADRNLFLDGFSYDGVEYRGLKKVMGWNQTAEYQLRGASPAMRAADFIDGIGVAVHLDYLDTSYGTPDHSRTNTPLIASSLAYLGVDAIRVGLPSAITHAALDALAAEGIRFDFLMPAVSSDALIAGQIASILPYARSVIAVEGPNEINLFGDFRWNGEGGYEAARQYQHALAKAVRATPELAGIDIYALTLGGVGARDYEALGDLSADTTAGNMHVYFEDSRPPADTIQYAQGLGRVVAPGQPIVFTETNYTSAPGIRGSVTEAVQAKYDLDLIMDAAQAGVTMTYFYELLDEFPDPTGQANNEWHYGLFRHDGTPKPAATAIGNLTALLADDGTDAATFAAGTLDYALSGLPASGNSMLLAKSSGTFDLVVWAEPRIWDVATQTEVAATVRDVLVEFGVRQALVEVFDPLLGTQPIATYRDVTSLPLSVTDHPLVLQVGAPRAAPPVAEVPAVAQPDTLVIELSEDAWTDHAQFLVTLDGVQLGGVRTASAARADGRAEKVTLTGYWGTGAHEVTVEFLNDASVGTAASDRNLYVEGISINGAPSAGAVAVLSGGEKRRFVVGETELRLRLSEDAWQGDARFAVAVDGVPVGDTRTVTALRSDGATEDFLFRGPWGPGRHEVTVDFLNDAFEPGLGDRNLIVDEIIVEGINRHDPGAILYGAGPARFDVVF